MSPHPLSPRLAALLVDMPVEELAFTPVPVRARHDGWTVDRQRGLILRLALAGCVSVAARGVGVTRKSAYRLLAQPGAESFAASWDKAIGWSRDRIVDRAIEGAGGRASADRAGEALHRRALANRQPPALCRAERARAPLRTPSQPRSGRRLPRRHGRRGERTGFH